MTFNPRRNFVLLRGFLDGDSCENCQRTYEEHIGEAQACPTELDNQELLVVALGYVNDLRVAYGKEPITTFVPTCVNEDNDAAIEALREACGRSLDWDEFDGQTHWLGTWNDWAPIDAYRFHLAWGTKQRISDEAMGRYYDVEVPEALAQFAFKVSEGEYPELEREMLNG